MNKKLSGWYISSDWAAMISFHLVIPIIAIAAGCLLPVVSFLKTSDMVVLFNAGLGVSSFGSILLFFARLPLYRQRRFWTFGLRELPTFNRKFYWVAYILVAAGVLLLGIVWLKLN